MHLLTLPQLNAGHAATAADVAHSTAFRRIAEAKKAAEEGIISTTVPAGDAEAFKVLLKYAQACGTNVGYLTPWIRLLLESFC
jgi:hypothetical protein